MISINYLRLTKELVIDKIDDLALICSDVPHENWNEQQYLTDLPGKWDLSIAAFSGNILLGYIIASEKEPFSAHIHKFIVNPSFRRQGIGREMLKKFISGVSENITKISLKVYDDNYDAVKFYESAGFIINENLNGLIRMELQIDKSGR